MQQWMAVLSVCLFLSSCSGQPPVPVPPSASPLPSIAPSQQPQPSSQVIPSPTVSPSSQLTATPLPSPVPTPILSSYPVEVVAGSGQLGFEDGPALQASFNSPKRPCFDSRDGSMYIPDTHLLRKLTRDGRVTTVAGSQKPGYQEGAALTARFDWITSCVVDPEGNVLLADSGNGRIRRLTPQGEVHTFLGNGKEGTTEGSSAAVFEDLADLFLLPSGELYITDSFRLRKFAGGKLVTLNQAQKGEAHRRLSLEGPLQTTNYLFGRSLWIAQDDQANFYVADYYLYHVRRIDPQGQVSKFSMDTEEVIRRYGIDNAEYFSLRFPFGIAFDSLRQTLYIVDGGNLLFTNLKGEMNKILGVLPNGEETFFNIEEGAIAMGPDDQIYVADRLYHQIRRVVLPSPSPTQNR